MGTMAFGLEINEARSIYLVIDDNLLLLVRKVLNLSEGLLFVPGSESRHRIYTSGPEILKCEGE